MKTKLTLALALCITALCAGSTCSDNDACVSFTKEVDCLAGKGSQGEGCVWYNNACGVPTSSVDKVPPTVICANTLQVDCNTHAVAGVPCYFVGSTCVSVTGCSVFDAATCGTQQLELVAGGCVWDTTTTPASCIPEPTKHCNFNRDACLQFRAWTDKSSECNGVKVKGESVCSWKLDPFFGGNCSAIWTTKPGVEDPCNTGTATTCLTADYSAACSWN